MQQLLLALGLAIFYTLLFWLVGSFAGGDFGWVQSLFHSTAELASGFRLFLALVYLFGLLGLFLFGLGAFG